MKNRQFYVYMFWRKDKNEVFYIGKGTKGRHLDKINNRNQYFKRICEKTETYSTIYKNNLSEQEAFDLERTLIKEYREKGLAYTNFHEGGRGGNVYAYDGDKRKEEMKKKCRLASSGNKNPMYGKSWHQFSTPEKIKNHRKNISLALKKRYEDEEMRKITAEASRKMWQTSGHKEKYRMNNTKRVHMYDENMVYIRTFISLYDALEFLGLKSHTTLLKSIRENKKYKNYFWRREEQKGVETIEISSNNNKDEEIRVG